MNDETFTHSVSDKQISVIFFHQMIPRDYQLKVGDEIRMSIQS